MAKKNSIVDKSQFIMSLVEQIDKSGVGPQHKSIIDRCTAQLYQEAAETGIIPTLSALREKLLVQPEAKAQDIALSLEPLYDRFSGHFRPCRKCGSG